MYAEFKIVTWERIRIPEDIQEEVMAKIKSEEITTGSELCDEYPDCVYEGPIPEIESQMTVTRNNGFSTIELREGKGEGILWGNGVK